MCYCPPLKTTNPSRTSRASHAVAKFNSVGSTKNYVTIKKGELDEISISKKPYVLSRRDARIVAPYARNVFGGDWRVVKLS